jgi:hypothetical protein
MDPSFDTLQLSSSSTDTGASCARQTFRLEHLSEIISEGALRGHGFRRRSGEGIRRGESLACKFRCLRRQPLFGETPNITCRTRMVSTRFRAAKHFGRFR